MGISGKIRTALQVLRKNGLHGVVSILVTQYGLPIPQSAKYKWQQGVENELRFWDEYFRTKGLEWADSYGDRFDPERLLQARPSALLPPARTVHILDVGAGPLTYLGMKCEGKHIDITAVDPLADEYDKMLDKHKVQPLVRTQKLAAEDLSKRFASSSFDLVFARNCIDHSYDPERAILQMLKVVKNGMYVLLEHIPNEGERENYKGLHQWNFSMSSNGDFLITSKAGQINMTRKYAKICRIACELLNEEGGSSLLVTRIQKK